MARKKVYIPKHTRKRGKISVSSYDRPKRPKGKKKKLGKWILEYRTIQDEYGRKQGLKLIKKRRIRGKKKKR